MAYCKYHPDRSAVGVCMRCRAVICADCCTRLEGINHCHACLRELGQKPALRRRPNSTFLTTVLLGMMILAFFGIFWLAQGKLAP